MLEYASVFDPPLPRRLMVIGSPRSGSRFFCDLLRRFGMRVRHERMGEDGIVSPGWLALRRVDDPLIHGTGRQDYEFDTIIHLVRHPLRTIASLSVAMSRVWWDWQEPLSHLEVPDPKDLERIAAFWVFWSDGSQHIADQSLRLEDVAHLGDPEGGGPPRDEVKITDLGTIREAVEQRCELYGYKL